jgi:hypothetical protein
LHLDVPAEIAVLEVEPREGLATHDAHGAQVGKLHLPDLPDEPRAEPIPEPLEKGKRTRLARAQHPGANNQVPLSLLEEADKALKVSRIVRQVCIHEHHRVNFRPQTGKTRAAGLAIASPWFHDYFGTGGMRRLGSAITAAIVHDDELEEELTRNLSAKWTDRFRFVQGRDDEGNLFSRQLLRTSFPSPFYQIAF